MRKSVAAGALVAAEAKMGTRRDFYVRCLARRKNFDGYWPFVAALRPAARKPETVSSLHPVGRDGRSLCVCGRTGISSVTGLLRPVP